MFPSGINCYKPANGETVCMTTIPTITVDMSLDLLKRKVTSLESKGQFFMLWWNQSHGTRAVMLDEKLRPTAGTFSQIKAESRFVLEALAFLYHPAWRILYHTTSLFQALMNTRKRLPYHQFIPFTKVVWWYWEQRSGFWLRIVLFCKGVHSHGGVTMLLVSFVFMVQRS